MAGLAHGWDTTELNRASGEVFVGLAALAVDALPTIDLDTVTPDATANPDAMSLGYTNEGWTAAARPSFQAVRVDEEEDAVSTFITSNEVTLSGAIRQVKNLERLALITPGSVHTPLAAGVEKLTGGGLRTFSYTTAVLLWEDPNEPGVVWAFGLYKCINTAGLEIGVGRTRDSAVNVTLTGYADSTRDAGDRTFFFARLEEDEA